MDEATSQILPILQTLLPGFVTTIIFYWLSSVKRPNQFERVIQALVCSGLIKLLVDGVMVLALWLGNWAHWGEWSENISTAWSLLLAVVIGLGLAYCSHHDVLYRFARRLRLTSRMSVGEWRYAFIKYSDRGVVLNLLDGRRLWGYPKTWPADPEGGHFLMSFPQWVVGTRLEPCVGLSFILIANEDVLWVEFLEPQEVTQ